MTAVRRSPSVRQRTVFEQVHLYHPETKHDCVLAGSATVVWALCDGTLERDALVAEVARVHELPPAAVRADVLAVLQELEGYGFVEV